MMLCQRFTITGRGALPLGAIQRGKQVQRAIGDHHDIDICENKAAYSSSSWSKSGWWASDTVGLAGVEIPRRREKVVMPLIHPKVHGTPFAVGIEMMGHINHDWQGLDQSDGSVCSGNVQEKGKRDGLLEDIHDSDSELMYELRFVLDGKGFLCQGDEKGYYEKVDDLQPGDAIACTPGVATVEEGAELGNRIVTMVVYVPKMLVEGIDDTINLVKAVDIANRFVGSVWKEETRFGCVSDILSEEDMLSVLRGSGAAVDSNNGIEYDVRGDQEARQSETNATLIGQSERDKKPFLQSTAEYNSASIEKDSIVKMRLSDVSTFMLPDQTNRLALMFDPLSQIPFPFVFGVEIFEPGHRTNPHVHTSAYELFFILSGEGEGFCNSERFPVRPGDIVVFHPGSTHGIDNGNDQRMYCVEIMLPDQNFAEFVRAGQLKDLHLDDLCILARIGCA